VEGPGVRNKAKRAYEEAQPNAKVVHHDHPPGPPHFQHKNSGKGKVYYRVIGIVAAFVAESILWEPTELGASERGANSEILEEAVRQVNAENLERQANSSGAGDLSREIKEDI